MYTVDAAADAAVADIGVHGIGEIDRIGAARQRYQIALGGETEDLVMKQLELGVLEELLGAVALGQQIEQTAQPAIGIGLGGRHELALLGFLIGPGVLV